MDQKPKILSDTKLILDGFIYLRSRKAGNRVYWDCKKLRSKECSARAVTLFSVDGEIVVIKGPGHAPHSHPPNREEAEAEVVLVNIKRKAEEHPEQPPTQILRNELPNVSLGVISHLPDRGNITRIMRRQRRRNLPPNPKSLADLDILPDRFQQTFTGDRFLLYDSHPNIEARVLVFATRRNLEVLSRSGTWFLDGTFKVRNKSLSYILEFSVRPSLFNIYHLCRWRQQFSHKFSQFWEQCLISGIRHLQWPYLLYMLCSLQKKRLSIAHYWIQF